MPDQELSQVEKQLQQINKAAKSLTASLESLAKSYDNLSKGAIKSTATALGALAKEIKNLGDVRSVGNAFRSFAASLEKSGTAVASLRSEYQALIKDLKTIKSLSASIKEPAAIIAQSKAQPIPETVVAAETSARLSSRLAPLGTAVRPVVLPEKDVSFAQKVAWRREYEQRSFAKAGELKEQLEREAAHRASIRASLGRSEVALESRINAQLEQIAARRAAIRASLSGSEAGLGARVSQAREAAILRRLPSVDVEGLPTGADYRAAIARNERALMERLRTAAVEEASTGVNLEQVTTDNIIRLQQVSKAEEDAARKAVEAANRQRELVKAFGGVSSSVENAEAALKKYGVSMKDLKSVFIDPTTATRIFTFENRTTEGVIQRATLAVDRFGNVTNSSRNRVRSFADTVANNTVKVLQWGIAVGVVYGAMHRFSEVFTILKNINESMSNLAFSSNRSMQSVQEFFDSAARAALETGTSVKGVLDVYDDAIRATSALGNTPERFSMASNLVRQVMVFTRLSGLEAKQALDMLVGALRQVGDASNDSADKASKVREAFSEEKVSRVLDMWVYLAKSANISMQDLAETFSITGSAALEAGVKMENLAAMATVLSESTSKSAAEVGNTIRRLIGQTESETGIKALRSYGVAIEDVTGRARNWDDVMTDVAEKIESGALTQDALREIAYAIGGGPRGSADFIILIKSWDEVLNKAQKARTESKGAAEAVMDIKMKTLVSSLNKLETSFLGLVNALGEEGLLKAITDLVKGLTSVLGLFKNIVELLGPATLRITAFGMAASALAKYGPWLTKVMLPMLGLGGETAAAAAAAPRVPLMTRIASNVQSAKGGLALSAAFAATSFTQEEPVKGANLIRAGATMGGAVISTLLSGSPVVGALIGNVIGEVVVQKLGEGQLMRAPLAGLGEKELRDRLELLKRSFSTAQIGTGVVGTAVEALFGVTGLAGYNKEITDMFLNVYAKSGKDAAMAFLDQLIAGLRAGATDPGNGNIAASAGSALFNALLAPNEQDIRSYAESLIETYDEIVSRGLMSQEQEQAINESLGRRNKLIKQANDEVLTLSEQFDRIRSESLRKKSAGELGSTEYKNIVKGFEAAYKQAGLVTVALDDVATSARDVGLVFATTTPEIRQELVDLSTDIFTVEDALSKLAASGGDQAQIEAYTKRLNTLREELKATYELAEKTKIGVSFKFSGFDDLSELSAAEIEEVKRQALDLQNTYADTFKQGRDEFAAMMESFVILSKDGFTKIDGIGQAFFNIFLRRMEEQKRKMDEFNLERLKDVSPEEFPELERRVKYWERFLNQIPGYSAANPPETFNLVIGEDPQWRRLVTTQEALRYAIEELTEIEKKKLEGMWNIPEGATVMVPLTSLYYAPKGGAGNMPTSITGALGTTPTIDVLSDIPPAAQQVTNSFDQVSTSGMDLSNAMVMAIENLRTVRVGDPSELKRYDIGIPMSRPTMRAGEIASQYDIYARGPANVHNQDRPSFLGSLIKPLSDFIQRTAPNEFLKGGGSGGGERTFASLNSAATNLAKAASYLSRNITVNTTVYLDGRVVARNVSSHQSTNLSRAARGYGYNGGGVT